MAKLAAELRANRALVTLLAACTAPRCSGIGPSPFTHAAHVHRHHYRTRTGSTGSPGRWITGSLGRWVTKCDQVPSLVSTDWHPGDGRESCSPWDAAARASDVVSHNQPTNTYRVHLFTYLHIECPVSITSYAKCPSGGDQPWVPRRSINVSSHRGTPTTN